jgi:hypothetical protein
LINAAVSKNLIGIDPHSTPITAKTYAEKGYPFFALYEELSGISGDFSIKSWAAMDKEKSNNPDFEGEEHLKFPTIMLTTVDKKGKFLLVMEIEKMVSGLNIVSNFQGPTYYRYTSPGTCRKAQTCPGVCIKQS